MRVLATSIIFLIITSAAAAQNSTPSPAQWKLGFLLSYLDSPETTETERFWVKAYIQGAMVAAINTRVSVESGSEEGGKKNRALYKSHPCAGLSNRTAAQSIAALRTWMQKMPAKREQQNPALAIAMEVRDTCAALKASR
jgi:hypothetical protein